MTRPATAVRPPRRSGPQLGMGVEPGRGGLAVRGDRRHAQLTGAADEHQGTFVRRGDRVARQCEQPDMAVLLDRVAAVAMGDPQQRRVGPGTGSRRHRPHRFHARGRGPLRGHGQRGLLAACGGEQLGARARPTGESAPRTRNAPHAAPIAVATMDSDSRTPDGGTRAPQ